MKTVALVASASTALLITASCVVTDVDEADPQTGGTGGVGTGAAGTGAVGNGDPTGGGSTGGTGATGGTGLGGQGPGDTFGIDCGADTCDASQVCCVASGSSACMTEQECQDLKLGGVIGGEGALMKCDDADDCDGNPCCVSYDDPFHLYECSLGSVCPLHESCASGGGCADDGDDCVPTQNTGSGYKCVEGGASVGCETETCAANTPVCCASGSPGCVAHGDACTSAFECDGASDCGGSLCCATTDGSSCVGECDDPFILCDDLADCPPTPGAPKSCDTNVAVGPAPGYKVCIYQ